MTIFLMLGGMVIAAWSLVAGFRSKEMTAMGVPYGLWKHSQNPGMFWLATAFNLMAFFAFLILFLEESAQ